MKRAGKRTRAHKAACKRYREKMWLDNDGHVFCESKNCDDPNTNFPPHSVHHIMSAGLWPSHEHLHDDVNLIMLCYACHREFDDNKRKDEHEELVEERGLLTLFKRS